MKKTLSLILLAALLAACQQAQVPANYQQVKRDAPIYPDYTDVTIPVNMAPLNFELLAPADEAVTRFTVGDNELVCGGLKVRPDIDEWRSLTAAACGDSINVEVFARKDGQWVRFTPYHIYVSPDSIDPYLSYRMISPSYVSYEELTINQRCLENFDEQVIVDNMLCSTEAGGQCINCHNYQQWNPERMQFHARHANGGTVIVYDGQAEKVNLQNETMLSPGVYPAWHPSQKLIAYSTNMTFQTFHTVDLNKIEVIDAASDLILYDIDNHQVTPIEQQTDELETFPCWSPDGRWLYFASAHFEYPADTVDMSEITLRAQEVKYNLYRKSFNPDTREFGDRELVFAADTMGMSATLPRISPDGRFLIFTLGEWGNFHIWHRDADLWLLPLSGEGRIRPLNEVNSDDTDSYHSWSSNGRWVVFSSRRYDGIFTRPFFAHIDADGQASKPFELPMEDPDRHRQLLKSYNVPELMRGPVKLTPQQAAVVLKGEGLSVK